MSSVAVPAVTVRTAEPMRTRLALAMGFCLDLLHEGLYAPYGRFRSQAVLPW